MSFECVEAVLEKSEARMAERLVLICLAERADENRQCFPSKADIAHRSRLNDEVVGRILERLEQSKELVRLMRIGASAKYIVATGLTPEQVEKCARKAWGKSLREVVATNKVVAEKLGRGKGHTATLLAGVDGFDPSSGSRPTHLAGVDHPSSGARCEPSVTIREPSSLMPAAPDTPPTFKGRTVRDMADLQMALMEGKGNAPQTPANLDPVQADIELTPDQKVIGELLSTRKITDESHRDAMIKFVTAFPKAALVFDLGTWRGKRNATIESFVQYYKGEDDILAAAADIVNKAVEEKGNGFYPTHPGAAVWALKQVRLAQADTIPARSTGDLAEIEREERAAQEAMQRDFERL